MEKLEQESRHRLEDDSQVITKGKNDKLIELGTCFSWKASNCLINRTESQPRGWPRSLGQSASRSLQEAVMLSYFPCCNHILSDSQLSRGGCDKHLYEPVNEAELMSAKYLAYQGSEKQHGLGEG